MHAIRLTQMDQYWRLARRPVSQPTQQFSNDACDMLQQLHARSSFQTLDALSSIQCL